MRLYSKFDPEDFHAKIRFLPAKEGGKRQYPNGIRFDFQYAEDANNLYMIPPDFFGANGDSLPIEVMLPLNEWLNARMYVIVPEMIGKIHSKHIKTGTRFYCCDGSRHVAEGVVTKIIGLIPKNK